MQEVKNQLIQLMHMHQLNLRREEDGLSSVPVGLHLVFTGNPGTGKTTVARLVAELYRALGLLPRGHLVEVQRADLVGGYVGQTALKVKQTVKSAMGGILFIDEAYSLASRDDFGSEAVSTLVKMMEDHRDKLSVIVAGYKQEMEYFISSNTGLRSRFQRYISFRDYEPFELTDIFALECKQHKIELSPEIRDELLKLFSNLPSDERNGNGRTARNFFEIMYARMASRVGEDGVITQDELDEGFTVEDIPEIQLPEEKRIGFHRRN
jgi:SpoVK/Ycf46/Vps4 family AAA+-type ATPase